MNRIMGGVVPARQGVTLMLAVIACLSCADTPVDRTGVCDSDDAGLTLPAGFCARVFADEAGVARHLAVAANGDVYVALEDPRTSSAGTTKMPGPGGVLALRDTTGDGRADLIVRVSEVAGSGIALRGDTLYFSSPTAVFRYRIDPARFGVLLDSTLLVADLPAGGHSSRSLALGDSSVLFVNIGSDTDVCRGQDPCAELSTRAAIWRFNTTTPNQSMFGATRYASGIRNAVGITWNPALRSLFATQQGRDNLGKFREIYDSRENDALPSEEFMRVVEGDDFGWPYCYHDWRLNRKVLAPEYGGDGVKQGRCERVARPFMGFPGHWAPTALLFYDGAQFPERYRGGVFIAFHGSWNRRVQDGYKIVFVPFRGAVPEGDYEIFADGFAGGNKSPSGARHRPVGLAVAPDGSLYITDDQRGRIYNIRYQRGSQ